ncbi:MAG: DNA adenine methylase [Deltaproteobacteria bacterium]|nr:DNA adenine methylase [Deltaproteobacteria bacterium]
MAEAALARVPLVQVPASAPTDPFIKWVGGKRKLLPQLEPLMPPGVKRRRHVEPFVGGGAFFFARAPRNALLCDVNPALVATYEAVRDELDAVISGLAALARRHGKEAYYGVRERYNAARTGTKSVSKASQAAMFIYLNKTCFNGLHRVNRKGEFNVPMGRYKNPRILDEERLIMASAALQSAEIQCQGFEGLLRSAKPGDFIYLDPPYEPVSRTASFTSYSKDGFSQEDQTRLRDVFAALDQRGCKLMLSNSDVPFIRELYADWNIHVVHAARAVNSDASGRGKVPEVVVTSY